MDDYPDSIWAKILRGRALIRTGAPDSPNADRDERLRRGEQVLREAWKQDPNSVESIFRLAVAVEYLGRLDESMELYGKAIEIKPDFTMAYHNLAYCHEKKGDVDAAIRSMRTAVEVQPDFLEGLRALGNWLIQQGQYAEAEKYLSSAAKLSPEDATIRMLLGRARQAQRD
jgi:Flp pilus assembly protein TadD